MVNLLDTATNQFLGNTNIYGSEKVNLDSRLLYGFWNYPNTWGFKQKINEYSFCDKTYVLKWDDIDGSGTEVKSESFSAPQRSKLLELLRKVTAVFDTLGYIPGVSTLSGLIRIICAVVADHFIEKGISKGVIKGRYRDEARWTSSGHKLRGFIEMIPIIGQIINLSLDITYHRKWSNGKEIKFLTSEQLKEHLKTI